MEITEHLRSAQPQFALDAVDLELEFDSASEYMPTSGWIRMSFSSGGRFTVHVGQLNGEDLNKLAYKFKELSYRLEDHAHRVRAHEEEEETDA